MYLYMPFNRFIQNTHEILIEFRNVQQDLKNETGTK